MLSSQNPVNTSNEISVLLTICDISSKYLLNFHTYENFHKSICESVQTFTDCVHIENNKMFTNWGSIWMKTVNVFRQMVFLFLKWTVWGIRPYFKRKVCLDIGHSTSWLSFKNALFVCKCCFPLVLIINLLIMKLPQFYRICSGKSKLKTNFT